MSTMYHVNYESHRQSGDEWLTLGYQGQGKCPIHVSPLQDNLGSGGSTGISTGKRPPSP